MKKILLLMILVFSISTLLEAQAPLYQGSTTLGALGTLSMCSTTTNSPVYTPGTINPCSIDANGLLRVVASTVSSDIGIAVTTSYASSGISTNATSVKASSGNIYWIHATNTTATLYYLRMYNLSTTPTCSAATGFVETIPIAASATGAGFVRSISASPQGYSNGIGYCITAGGGNNDNSNAAAGVYVTIGYK